MSLWGGVRSPNDLLFANWPPKEVVRSSQKHSENLACLSSVAFTNWSPGVVAPPSAAALVGCSLSPQRMSDRSTFEIPHPTQVPKI